MISRGIYPEPSRRTRNDKLNIRLFRRGVYPEHIRGACTERIEVLSVNSVEGLLAMTVVVVIL
ncbi:MAG: hypothetical protein HYW01_00555 [Deltaproteobacteria bacterium]|nr:hypothetical protein [Deltaproteobacteria bacterium]